MGLQGTSKSGKRPCKPTAPRTKLTVEQVLEARLRAKSGVAIARLAKEYGVSANTVANAVQGRSWKQLPFPPKA